MIKGLSVTNLDQLTQFIAESIDLDAQVNVIYKYFTKAFDSLDHGLLLTKLYRFSLLVSMVKLFQLHLLGRQKQYVMINGNKSLKYTGLSGFPEGTKLRPIIFISFINAIVNIIDAERLLYVDDLKIYCLIKNFSDCLELVSNIQLIDMWYKANITHTVKGTYVRFVYKIDGTILD